MFMLQITGRDVIGSKRVGPLFFPFLWFVLGTSVVSTLAFLLSLSEMLFPLFLGQCGSSAPPPHPPVPNVTMGHSCGFSHTLSIRAGYDVTTETVQAEPGLAESPSHMLFTLPTWAA